MYDVDGSNNININNDDYDDDGDDVVTLTWTGEVDVDVDLSACRRPQYNSRQALSRVSDAMHARSGWTARTTDQ